jgi:hypothetical protein
MVFVGGEVFEYVGMIFIIKLASQNNESRVRLSNLFKIAHSIIILSYETRTHRL